MENPQDPFLNNREISTESLPLNFTDIVSGIIVLSAKEGDLIPVHKIHCILREMKSHEPILDGLHFSLKGHVCFSDRIDQAIKNLVDWRSLRFIDNSTVIVDRSRPFQLYLSRFLTNSQLNAVHSTSLRCHARIRWNKSSSERTLEHTTGENRSHNFDAGIAGTLY